MRTIQLLLVLGLIVTILGILITPALLHTALLKAYLANVLFICFYIGFILCALAFLYKINLEKDIISLSFALAPLNLLFMLAPTIFAILISVDLGNVNAIVQFLPMLIFPLLIIAISSFVYIKYGSNKPINESATPLLSGNISECIIDARTTIETMNYNIMDFKNELSSEPKNVSNIYMITNSK